MRTNRIDVSRRWKDDLIPAVLVLKSRRSLTPQQALARFKRSVAQWLANTPRGLLAWEGSHQDFNYGDFREYALDNDNEFIKFLNANGLNSATVDRFEAADCGETWDTTIQPELATG